MTALVGFLGLYERAGLVLADEPTAGWWVSRAVWVVGPGVLLAAMVAVLSRRRPERGSAAADAR